MKKLLLAAALVLCMLCVCTAFAVELPEVGDQIHGFTVVEKRDFPLIDATVVRLEHDKTGAQVYYIANDDPNRAFDLVFRTTAVDNTGLPHVFEHATLSGSEKYPSADLFFNLSYQTYNSYMNASTYDIMTSYPVASYSEAQLLRLADFYTDSCLHPMIMTDESIFRTEAWRYRLNDADAELTIEGTVYSEMLGANTLSRAANQNAYRAAFPGSTIGNNQGGDNDAIPDMTWQMLRDYHDTYYHPSNCVCYLYGDIEDYGAFLALLDDAFAPYDRKETSFEDVNYTPLTEGVTLQMPYAMEEGSNTSRISVFYYVIPCPNVTEDQYVDFDMAVGLMNSDTSGLMIALKEAIPHGSFSIGVNLATPVPAVIVTATGVDPEDADTFRRIVDEQIVYTAENGFTDEQIDAEVAALAISVRLMREDADVGVGSVIPSFAYYYMASGNPWYYIDYVDSLDTIAEKNADGVYAGLIGEHLVGNTASAFVVTYPQPGLKEQQDAELAASLAEVKAGMSDDEIAALVESSNAEKESNPDTPAMVASLTAVTKDTLPEEIKTYDIHDYTDENGVRHIEAVAGVDGIGQVDVMLNASGIAVEDLHYFRLLTHMVGQVGTEHHSRAEVTQLMSRYMYNGSLRCSLLTDPEGNAHLFYRMSWIAADDDLPVGYDLAYELAFEMDLTDTEAVLAAVRATKSSVRSTLNGGYTVVWYRQMSRGSEVERLYSYMNMVEYYQFLEWAEEMLTNDPDTFIANLIRVRDQLRNGNSAVVMYAGSEESIAINKPLADAFIARLDNVEIVPVSYDAVPVPDANEGLVIDSNVNYNVVTADFATLGLEGYTADLDVVSAWVADQYLMPLLRDQYGAYGAYTGSDTDYGVYIITYRDPNVNESFAVIESLGDIIAADAENLDQETLDGYILSSYSAYAQPTGELSGAVSAEIDLLEGTDPMEKVTWMRQIKAITVEDVRRYASMYTLLGQYGSRGTAGSFNTITANASNYDAVLNPLGMAAAEEVAIADIPEDYPYAVDIAAVLDAGAMTADGSAFRPDDPATVGDLAYAFYALGMQEKPESGAAAYELFAAYGLMLPGANVDDELTYDVLNPQLQCFLLNGYGFQFDEVMSGEGDTVTRGELAHILYYIWLEE